MDDSQQKSLDIKLIEAVNAEDFDGALNAVEAGASVNFIDDEGFTPLMLSVFRSHRDITEYLIGMGADVNLPNQRGVVPLHYAALKGDMQMCELLYVNGAEVDCPIYDGLAWVPLHCAAFSGKADVFEFIAGIGGNVKIKDSDGYMPHEVAPRGTDAARLIEAKVAPMLPAPAADTSSSVGR
jgi:ankyrin repeat protein